MKNTINFLGILVLLTFIFSEKTMALVPLQTKDIDLKKVVTLVPTATPTQIILKKIDPNINFKIIPTTKATITPSSNLSPTVEIKSTITPEVTPETKITDKPSTKQEPSITVTEKSEDKIDLKNLFFGITLGLLGLIIVIQLWPKKKIDRGV